MKVIVNSYDLANAVNKVAKAVATKDINGKILEGIKLSAKNDSFTLTAYDSEIGIETNIKCETIEDGEMVIAGKIFAEYINKVSNGNADIEISSQENGQVKIASGKIKFVVSTLNAKDFPIIKQDLTENSFDITVADFKRLVSQTAFCSSTDESRPILKGCLLKVVSGNELTISAVDGFRLGVAKCKVNNIVGTIDGIVLARALIEMTKLVGNEEVVKIYIDKHRIMLKTEDTIFSARLLIGQFVNCANLLKSPTDKSVVANREELISTLDRLSILAKTTNNLIAIKAVGNVLQMNANTEIGNMEEEIEIEKQGSDFMLHLNYKYLLDILKVIPEEQVRICVNTDQTPILIRSVDEMANFDYLVMPVRVNRA